MAYDGQHFMINGRVVTTPDEEVWTPSNIGEAVEGTQRRSPYWILEWRKRVGNHCYLDWFAFDNTQLTSIVATPPGSTDTWERYTDAFCKGVSLRKVHRAASEIVARFLVNVG